MPLHFLVLVSLVQSNPSRLSSCKRLLINLVAHDFRMKLMVLLIQGAVSCILVDIIVYRKMRNHLFSFFRLIQRIIHDHSLLDGVAYVIPCNITLQYIDMAYRLVDIYIYNMLYYMHDYTRTSIHTYCTIYCKHAYTCIATSKHSLHPYLHTSIHPHPNIPR